MLSSAIVVSLSSSVLYFQRREDDAVAVFVHGLRAAVTPSLGTRPRWLAALVMETISQ
jgi:hypothetical protein